MPGFYRTEVDPFTNKILKFCPICNVDTKGNPTRHMKTYHPDFWENRIKAMNGVESEIEPIPSPQISVYNVFINSVSNAGLGHDDIPGFSDNPEKKMDHNKSPIRINTTSNPTRPDLPHTDGVVDEWKTARTKHAWNPYPGTYHDKFTPFSEEGDIFPFSEPWTLTPTHEEMEQGVIRYITNIAERKYELYKRTGIIKIRTPKGYVANKSNYANIDKLVCQPKYYSFDMVAPGAYSLHGHCPLKSMTVQEYKKKSEQCCPLPSDDVDKESLFWDSTSLQNFKALYGTDVQQSTGLFDRHALWNLDKLGETNPLRHIEKEYGGKIPGITKSYVYYGSWATSFVWHKENVDTPSLNYQHLGAKKIWYSPFPEDTTEFEIELKDSYTGEYGICEGAHRHKNFLLSPMNLQHKNIRYTRLEQEPGDFVVAFQGAYHCGYNEGFNCNEAINFATPRWIKLVKETPLEYCADQCSLKNNDFVPDLEMYFEEKKAQNDTFDEIDDDDMFDLVPRQTLKRRTTKRILSTGKKRRTK